MVAEGDSVMVAAELPNAAECGARKKEACSANKEFISNGGKPLQGSLPKTSSEDSNTSETHQKDKKKGFRKAPELQKFTLASFPTSKICIRRCELCGDCFTCFCRDFAIVSEETGPCCSWHAGWEKDSNSDNELDSFAEYDDELETIAEEWTERLYKCHKFSTGNRRHKPRNNRPKRAAKEKQLRSKDILRGSTGHPLIMVIVKQDISARKAARKEQLADAFAAKKENIEKKLKALKLERRGPPKNCVVNTTATVNLAQQKQQSQPVKYELREGDISQFTTSEDEAQLLTVLALIQHRDLLPEDYDLLLRLDENISKKTFGSNRLRSLRTKLLTDEDVKDIMNSDFAGATCAICMECYHADEVVKWLPCEHVFHSNCIDTWLSEAGSICPLDGLEV